jgi:membrane-associated phospholipid phosphatase
LRSLPSTGTVTVLAGGGAAALVVHPADDNVNEWAIDRGPASYVKLGNMLGDGWFQGGAALGTYVAGRLSGDPVITHLGSDLIRSQVLNAVLTRGLKLVAQRNRPHGGSDSMPSGHASAAFASATVIQAHYGWKGGMSAYAAASFMAWSRVRDDRHWLTDVIIGGAIGTIAGRTVTEGHRARWTIVPAATTQSAALVVVNTFR